MLPRPPTYPLFPYTTLFRSSGPRLRAGVAQGPTSAHGVPEHRNPGENQTWIGISALSGSMLGHSVRRRDRKSTRLNSSHTVMSYAVFCLKKKSYALLESMQI